VIDVSTCERNRTDHTVIKAALRLQSFKRIHRDDLDIMTNLGPGAAYPLRNTKVVQADAEVQRGRGQQLLPSQKAHSNVLTPRRMPQVTKGLTANLFHIVNSLFIEAMESGRERINDEAMKWESEFDADGSFA